MKYMLQVYFNGFQARLEKLPEAEQQAIFDEFAAFSQRAEIEIGYQLQPPTTAVTVAVTDGEVARTEGPNSTIDEPLAGFYVVEVADLDEATALVTHIPAARLGGTVEVRPILPR